MTSLLNFFRKKPKRVLSPAEQQFIRDWLHKHHEAMANAIAVAFAPGALGMFLMVTTSKVQSFIILVRIMATTYLIGLALYVIAGRIVNIRKYLPSSYLVYGVTVVLIAMLAFYARESYYLSTQEIFVFERVVQGKSVIVQAASETIYDVVVSSSFFLVGATVVMFTLPVNFWLSVVTACMFMLMSFYAYSYHDDRITWWSYMTGAMLMATTFSQRLASKTRSIALLELDNRALVAKAATARFDRDMEVAREIQNSMAPPGEFNLDERRKVRCYQFTHHKVGGDWLAVRTTTRGEYVLMVADATGKGMQAALVVHALQSLWARALEDPDFDPRVFMSTLNRTLIRMGQKEAHTLTMGIVVLDDSRVTYYSAGHPSVKLVLPDEKGGEKIKSLSPGGSVVGIAPEFDVNTAEFPISPDTRMELLLATDGIFDGLPHPRKSLLLLLKYLRTHGAQAVNWIPADDDKTLIWVTINPVARTGDSALPGPGQETPAGESPQTQDPAAVIAAS